MGRRFSRDAHGGRPAKRRQGARRTTREAVPSKPAQLLWLLIAAALFVPAAIASLRWESSTYDEPLYLVAGLSCLTLAALPHDLPHFNELARHGIVRVRLLDFGTAPPAYDGIQSDPVSIQALVEPAPGVTP